MRILSVVRGVAALSCVLVAACTTDSNSDTSTSSSGGTSGTTSSTSSSTGGASTSSGGSSGGTSGGSTSGSSGAASTSSGGTASSSSGGTSSSAMSCPGVPFTLCDNVAADTTPRTIVTAQGSTLGISGLVTIGMTRAQVKANFGSDPEVFLDAAALPLRPFYCAKRLAISYADQATGGVLDGALSDDDVVVRISTLDGFVGETDTGIAHGDATSEVTAAYSLGRVQVSGTIAGGPADAFPARGLFFTHNGSTVTSISVHSTYTSTLTPSPLNPSMDLETLKLGSGNTEVKAGFIGGTSFANVRARLGTPDVAGFASVNGQDVGYFSYANLGIRLGGLKGDATTVDEVTTNQIFLTPPFAGFDSGNTLGLGASKAEFDAAYGNPTTTQFDATTAYIYQVAGGLPPSKILVVFAQDTACVERAQVIVLGWVQF